MSNPLVGFAPWIVFWVVSSPSSWEWAALGAFLTALILAIPDAVRRRPKILDVGTIAFFGVLSVLGAVLDRADLDWLEDWSQALSSGALAVIALGSLAVVPFTEQYARDSTPEEYWSSPTFKSVNRVLTLVWGLVFLVSAILGVIAEEADDGSDLLNWIIPIVLVVGAVKFTAWYPDYVTGDDEDPTAAGAAASRR
jgi:hypothetical protein